MSDVTRILSAIEQGDPWAAERLLLLHYREFRKLAAQNMAFHMFSFSAFTGAGPRDW